MFFNVPLENRIHREMSLLPAKGCIILRPSADAKYTEGYLYGATPAGVTRGLGF